ncbi:MAG: hypothetical protein AAB367_01480 [Patescibacteria group bacterium]
MLDNRKDLLLIWQRILFVLEDKTVTMRAKISHTDELTCSCDATLLKDIYIIHITTDKGTFLVLSPTSEHECSSCRQRAPLPEHFSDDEEAMLFVQEIQSKLDSGEHALQDYQLLPLGGDRHPVH